MPSGSGVPARRATVAPTPITAATAAAASAGPTRVPAPPRPLQQQAPPTATVESSAPSSTSAVAPKLLLADVVEPVASLSGDAKLLALAPDERVAVTHGARLLQRLVRQERTIAAAIEARDPEKIAGGALLVETVPRGAAAIAAAAAPGSARRVPHRPGSASVAAAAAAPGTSGSAAVSPRPNSALRTPGAEPLRPAPATAQGRGRSASASGIPTSSRGGNNSNNANVAPGAFVPRLPTTAACQVNLPPSLLAFSSLAAQRKQLIGEGRYEEASSLVFTPAPTAPASAAVSRPTSARYPAPPTTGQRSPVPAFQSAGSVHFAPATARPEDEEGEDNDEGAEGRARAGDTTGAALASARLLSPSERIGLLNSNVAMRTPAREAHMPLVSVRTTYRSGPGPVAASAAPTRNGVKGQDPALSHFLDANDYSDADVVTPVAGEPSCIAFARYYVSTAATEATTAENSSIKCVMEPCKVLSFHPANNAYLVRWIRSGKTKLVKPLTIQFHHESSEVFAARVARAEERRDAEEAAIRYRQYILDQPDSLVLPVPEAESARIMQSVAVELPKRHLDAMQEALAEAMAARSFGIKRAVVAYRLRDPRERARLEELRFPPPPTAYVQDLRLLQTSVPVIEHKCNDTHGALVRAYEANKVRLVPGGPTFLVKAAVGAAADAAVTRTRMQSEFKKRRAYLQAELFAAHPLLYRSLCFAINRWFVFDARFLVQLDVSELQPPLELVSFLLLQSNHANAMSTSLQNEWMSSIVGFLQSELASTFNFFEDNTETFRQSRMFRYLRMINLCLSGQLQGLVYSSLNALTRFYESNQVPPAVLAALDKEREGHNREGHDFLAVVGCIARRAVAPPGFRLATAPAAGPEPHGMPPAERAGSVFGTAVSGVVPLVVIRLEEDFVRGAIVAVPSVPDVVEAMSDLLESIFRGTDNIYGLASQLFPLLDFTPTPLTESAQSLRDSDAIVRRCREARVRLIEGTERITAAVLRLFSPFSYLTATTSAEFVEAFAAAEPPPTLADYDHVCQRLTDHIEAIQQRSLGRIDLPLLRIDTNGVKSALTRKAQSLIQALLRHLIDRTNERIEAAVGEYASVHDRLLIEPTTPEELRELRAFVDGVPHVMLRLEAELDAITDNVQLLGKYGCMPDEAAFAKYWGAFSWPRKIDIVLDDVPFRMQSYRAQFVSQLLNNVETLHREVADITRAVAQLTEEAEERDCDRVLAKVLALEAELGSLSTRARMYNSHQSIFQQQPTRWTALGDVEKTFSPYAMLWKLANDARRIDVWYDSPLEKIKPEELAALHASWCRDIVKLQKALDNEAPIAVVNAVKEKVDIFKPSLPLIISLAKPSLLNRKRHMMKIGDLINHDKLDLRDRTLQDVLKLGLDKHIPEVQEISENADHEYKLEYALGKMKDEWMRVAFKLQEQRGTWVLKDTDDISNLLDESVLKTQTMLSSPYAGAILIELKPWEQKLLRMRAILDEWLRCQFGYSYLEPIFSHADIVASMPEEARLFEQVATLWVTVMEAASKVPNVVARCSEEKLLPQFQDANVKLDRILRELAKFLDTKRVAFPRFFFLSNDDLIEILSESKDPTLVQPHLKKCFEGIHRLRFQDTMDVTDMISGEGEVVPFAKRVNPNESGGIVEKWLAKVEAAMCDTVKDHIVRAVADYLVTPRTSWVLAWPGQVVLCASQIHWTMQMEQAIATRRLAEANRLVRSQLDALVVMVRGTLSAVHTCTLQALVVIEVHSRDITAALTRDGVQSLDAFSWISQLRYYLDAGNVVVRQTIASLPYGYEYLGNTTRLVVTPLTDRCYRTLTAAYHLNYGGAPEGPAGTGKTETTKDLAKAIGKQCVVYNCSEQIKAVEMEKLLRGLAACGAWGCFDEFNRIEIQVLSVIAQQVLTIQSAVAHRDTEFLFEGRYCSLKQGCSIFVTMNPGYAGRAELPDNLKALFRPVAMMVPDYALIAENSLFSCGFLKATALSKKIVAAYKLCSEQLSSQSHYDYGMRAVKSVLTAAQNLKTIMKDCDEAQVVLRAILDVNVPKFLTADASLFRGIISDLFGDTTVPTPDYQSLDQGLDAACRELNLQLVPFFELKVKQFYEMISVRHGVMVVGMSVSGKTQSLKALSRGLTWAKTELDTLSRAHMHVINPKSVTMNQLYGQSDASGTEWHDGILATAFRTCANDTRPDLQWVVLDGPVDALWIENMNTVLDDNKKLCLTNGDIIRMSPSMTMVFVVQDLLAASPATVSRCGMVYYEPKELGWKPLFQSWLNTLPSHVKDRPLCVTVLTNMINSITPRLHDTFKLYQAGVDLSEQILFNSFLRFLRVFIDANLALPDLSEVEDVPLTCYLEGTVIFALSWSYGAVLKPKSRAPFDLWLRSSLDNDPRSGKNAAYHPSVTLPAEHGFLFEFAFVVPRTLQGDYQWMDWLSFGEQKGGLVSVQQQLLDEVPYHQLVVPTADTACYSYIARLSLTAGLPLMLVGGTGTGKSLVLKATLAQQLDPAAFCTCIVQFSAQSTAAHLQTVVDARLERRGGRRYGPPVGKRMMLFIDDVGMPEADKYGTQPPIELLRQLLTSGGWFGSTKLDRGFHTILHTTVLAATQPSDGGRPPITKRLLRHFHSIFVAPQSEDTLKRLFQQFLDTIILQPDVKNPAALRTIRDTAVGFAVDVFVAVSETLLPTPLKSHYTFNLRDLCRLFQGVAVVDGRLLKDDTSLLSVIVHECLRVYGDRLICASDHDVFRGILRDRFAARFKRPIETVFPVVVQSSSTVPTATTNDGSANGTGGGDGGGSNGGGVAGMAAAQAVALSQGFNNLLYCDFADGLDDRRYGPISDYSRIKEVVERVLATFNAEATSRSARMNLVIFDYVVKHVVRVVRIIQQPLGSALLVGVGGSGRQSVARLATLIAGYTMRTVSVSKKYGRDQWRDDLGSALRSAGEKGYPTTFLLADTNIKDELFLEDVCNVLNSGEVPGLFAADAIDQICDSLRGPMKEARREGTREACWEFFVQRCRNNLHFALSFSPVGDFMRVCLRRFPSLVNCTTINWLEEWPSNGLFEVAERSLKPIVGAPLQQELAGPVAEMFVEMHKAIEAEAPANPASRKQAVLAYVTPTSFLDLLSSFRDLLAEKTATLEKTAQRYDNGLKMMFKTEQEVAEMQARLAKNQPVIEEAARKTAALIAEIDIETAEADKERAAVAREEAVANKIAEAAQAVKDDCEANLAEALPALNAATAAVTSIDKRQLVEIRSMQNPTDKVKRVIEAVCILLDVAPKEIRDPHSTKKEYDYWTPFRTKVMVDADTFRESLVSYDRENMKEEIFEQKILPYVHDRTFKPEAVANVSKALVGVCTWVIAMEIYYRVFKKVKPKKIKLAAAESDLRLARAQLAEKREKLRVMDEKLAEMKRQLDENTVSKRRLDMEQSVTEIKLGRAMRLIDGLGDEKERYKVELSRLQGATRTLQGDSALTAGVMTYLGPFTHDLRTEYTKRWKLRLLRLGLAVSEDYSLESFMSSSLATLQWKVNHLPADQFSIDSAVMITYGSRWPLIVDPQSQASTWIKSLDKSLAEDTLVVLRPTESGAHASIVNAVQRGYPVLLEDCGEELDPFLYPLLNRETTMYNGKVVITLGDAVIPYHPKFRLYMCTTLDRPTFRPETSTKVTVVSFFITPGGLTEQVMQRTIQHEEREQEDRKNKFIEQGAANRAQLLSIEKKILELISSGGDLLESDEVINELESSKRTSISIEQKLAEIEQFQRSFEKIRHRFSNLSHQVSALFFVVTSLSSIDPMYRFALQWYFAVLDDALEVVGDRDEDETREQRAANIVTKFIALLYKRVTLSLFAKDGLVFSFLFSARLSDVPADEMAFFATGGLDVPSTSKHLPCPAWLPERCYVHVRRAADQLKGAFADFARSVATDDTGKWFTYVTDEVAVSAATLGATASSAMFGTLRESRPLAATARTAFQAMTLPAPFETLLTPFQRVVVARCLRMDRVGAAASQFVTDTQGSAFLQPPILDIREVLTTEKNPATPLMFLLSSGGDPLAALRGVAEAQGMSEMLDTLSLGHGMGDRAKALIDNAKSRGRWVLLQNCHLYSDWLPQLSLMVDEFGLMRRSLDKNFRLWLTTMPTAVFPLALLQRSVKMVVEPPRGLKANLAKSYLMDPITDPKFFEQCVRPVQWKRLCFALCMFHAVAQERRAFGPLGWNIPYEFSDMDLRISLKQLHMFVNSGGVPVTTTVTTAATAATAGAAIATTAATAPVVAIVGGGAATATAMSALAPPAAVAAAAANQPKIPFDTLQYLIGECNYGGRVTDSHDRTLLVSLLSSHIGPNALNEGAQFDPDSGSFPMPPESDCAGYAAFASRLPDTPSPSIFGLHSNASITRYEREGQALLNSVMATLPRGGVAKAATTATTTFSSPSSSPPSTAGVSKGDPVPEMSTKQQIEDVCAPVLERVRQPYDLEAVERSRPITYEDSMNTVLIQELQRFNRLIIKIRSSVAALLRAVKGEIVMSSELDGMASDLLVGKVPGSWFSVSYPSLKPFGSFMIDLYRRLEVFDNWIRDGPPLVHWLGGFFFPQSFITAGLQNFCRANNLSIDSLQWGVEVLREPPVEPPPHGCYISGLFLEGCGWDSDNGTLAEQQPREQVVELPTLWLYNELAVSADGAPPESPTRDPAASPSPMSRTGGAAEGPQSPGFGSPASVLSNTRNTMQSGGPPSPGFGSPRRAEGFEPGTYACPVYRTSARRGVLLTTGHSTNFIMHFNLPIPYSSNAAHWVKRGAAIVTSLSF